MLGLHQGRLITVSRYDPRQSSRFRFKRHEYDSQTGTLSLVYQFDDHPELIENITFPHAPWPPEASRQAAFERAATLLHLIAGVSYYKAGAPPLLDVSGIGVDASLGLFLSRLYTQGLAEFAYVNDIDIRSRVNFQPSTSTDPRPHSLILPERALVAMGGGKDSLVGLYSLQRAGLEVLPVCVGDSGLIADTVKAAGLPLLRIERQLDAQLGEMNRQGALNGHVPVTAINSAICLCAAILYGYRHIVFSNERSADEATLKAPNGEMVNHQYSKSSAFEEDFRNVIASEVSDSIEYYSVLRPLSELAIVKRFSTMTEFHQVYSSCNRNFHLDGSRVSNRWCGDCPKCRFAALSLAVFMSPDEVHDIMACDLLNDAEQIDGFRELCELGRDKPFECVGEAGESRAALLALSRDQAWNRHVVVNRLVPELDGLEIPSLEELLTPLKKDHIPDSLRDGVYRAWQIDEAG